MSRAVGWVLLLALALLSLRQTQVWSSDRAFWAHEATMNPSLVRPSLNLAASAMLAGDCVTAETAFSHAWVLKQTSTDEQWTVCTVFRAQHAWLQVFCPTHAPDWPGCWR